MYFKESASASEVACRAGLEKIGRWGWRPGGEGGKGSDAFDVL